MIEAMIAFVSKLLDAGTMILKLFYDPETRDKFLKRKAKDEADEKIQDFFDRK